jgi:SagB-type dehydrogenase family enzyme
VVGAAAVNDPATALEYHALTEHAPNRGRSADVRLVRGYRPMDPARYPPPFKHYDEELIPLPAPVSLEVPAAAALSGTAREPRPLDAALLSTLLFRSAAVVRTLPGTAVGTMYFRAAGSAGNLHPLEVYVVAAGITGLDDAVYHYDALHHGLHRIAAASVDGEPAPALVVTGVPWRTAWKYTERGFRHLYWDCGTMLAHVLAVAEVSDVAARVVMGFVDADVTRLVGVDGEQEFPLAVVALAAGEPALQPAGEARSGRLASEPVTFPLITNVQRAGDLPDERAVAAWRMDGVPTTAAAVQGPDTARTLDATFERRGSTRRFRSAGAVPRVLLEWALAASARPVPGDFLEPGTTALSHRVAVHTVDGVEPGAYLWVGDGLDLVHGGDVRGEAQFLCYGQELGGEGAYTVFHCADLDLLYFLGSRGYRALQLEAGIVEGRLHLAAFALGYGATGLTFFDDEVRTFFNTRSSPMLVTAVGAPATRAPKARRPGDPVNLRQ